MYYVYLSTQLMDDSFGYIGILRFVGYSANVFLSNSYCKYP